MDKIGTIMDEYEFKRETFVSMLNVSKEVSQNMLEELVDIETIRLKAYIWAHTADVLEVQLDKPKFLDWLLGRRKTAKIEVKDMLIIPPVLQDETVRLYKISMDGQ